MDIVKAFVTIDAYVNNTPGETSILGELSTWSRTYSKEKGEYLDPAVPGFKLTTFRVSDDVTGTPEILDSTIVSQCLQVTRDCMAYAQSHIRPYDSIDFKNTIQANFHLRIQDLNFGNFRDNGFIALPEWISWKSKEHPNTVVKIWLSDSAFQNQYDEFSIVVIPPVDDLDILFGNYNAALTTIRDRTITDLSTLIQEAKEDNPETFIRIYNFPFVNSLNYEIKNDTNWAVLIYGKSGDNIDAIKDAIVEYLLANSSHARHEWEIIFPDIFKRTEFVLLPRWDKLSIPNLGELADLYSSILDPIECINFAKNAINFYDDSFIENNINILPYDYKALSIVSVNGNNNVDGARNLFDVFPDYIPIPSTSPDFNRMQIKTRDWIIFIQDLLIFAETMNEFTAVPDHMRRQIKGDILFVSAIYEGVNYLVAARSNSIYSV